MRERGLLCLSSGTYPQSRRPKICQCRLPTDRRGTGLKDPSGYGTLAEDYTGIIPSFFHAVNNESVNYVDISLVKENQKRQLDFQTLLKKKYLENERKCL